VKERVATLTNGDKVGVGIVETAFMSFELLEAGGYYMALYELYQLCLDANRRLFGNAGHKLMEVGLLESFDSQTKQATVHPAFRSVVLAAMRDLGGGRLSRAEQPRDIIREINESE